MPLRDTASKHAERIYGLAKWDPSDPPGPGTLLRRLLGDGCTKADYDRADGVDARVFLRDGAWRILVPLRLEGERLAQALARALARWYVLTQLPEDESTPDIDSIAAAVMLPDAAVPIAVEQFGRDAEAIASWLVIPSTIVARRITEAASIRSGLYPRLRMVSPESSR